MSGFKISTVLENRSELKGIAGNIFNELITGPTGPTGPIGDNITITNSLEILNLNSLFSTINNFSQSGLSVYLPFPTSNRTKIIKLSNGSFSTNINTGFGTVILESGESVTLLFTNSKWNIVSNNIVVPITQQGQKLVATSSEDLTQLQGFSVSLSSDGSILAVGAPDNGDTGSVYIFVRDINGFYTETTNLIGSGSSGISQQGISISLSGDGNTLAFGGRGDSTNIGATWIFTRSAGVWTQQGNKLVGSGVVSISNQGTSVSLSSDGNTLAFGGRGDNSNVGATWIFTRSAGVWTQQGSKLVGGNVIGTSQQGTSISLSNDGNIVAVGGPTDNIRIGAVWIFTRNQELWTQQYKIVGSGEIGMSEQGTSVSLSARGNTLAFGGPIDNGGDGAVWIFTFINNTWIQKSKIVGSGAGKKRRSRRIKSRTVSFYFRRRGNISYRWAI